MLSLIRDWEWVRLRDKWLSKPTPTPITTLEEPKHAGEEIAKCVHCHDLLKIRYHLRLVVHLRVDHKLSENAAQETTTWIMDRVYKARMENARLSREMGKL